MEVIEHESTVTGTLWLAKQQQLPARPQTLLQWDRLKRQTGPTARASWCLRLTRRPKLHTFFSFHAGPSPRACLATGSRLGAWAGALARPQHLQTSAGDCGLHRGPPGPSEVKEPPGGPLTLSIPRRQLRFHKGLWKLSQVKKATMYSMRQ